MYGYNTFHNTLMLELINNVHSGSVHQAYIFEGADGLNILESAKLFAAALTCTEPSRSPCGSCAVCKLSHAGTNPDIVFVNTGEKKSIGVDKIRELSKDVYIRPFESEHKIYIIEDGAALTVEAQNAMLKILEEPPEYAIFIIIAPSSALFLPTIVSRCTEIRFTPLSDEEMHRYITENFENKNIDFLTRFSQGIPKRCESIVNDPTFEPLRGEAFRMLPSLLSKHNISAYAVCNFLEQNKERAELILDLWQSFLRDIMLIQNESSYLVVNSDLNDKLSNLAGKFPDIYCIIALKQINRAKSMLKRYVNLHILALNLSFSIKKNIYGL